MCCGGFSHATASTEAVLNVTDTVLLCRGVGFGAALVLAHLERYHRPQDNTKLFFKSVINTIIEYPLYFSLFHHFGGLCRDEICRSIC